MEEFSDFASLVSRSLVMRLELEAALDAFAKPRPQPYAQVPVLCKGVLQAFGKRGGLRIRNPEGDDVTDTVRLDWPAGPEAFDKWRVDAERQLDRSVLRGPTDAEAPELRAAGWDPTVARKIADDRAAEERAQAARLLEGEPIWQSERLRDVVSARYMAIDMMEMLFEALAARGVSNLRTSAPIPACSVALSIPCRAPTSLSHSSAQRIGIARRSGLPMTCSTLMV